MARLKYKIKIKKFAMINIDGERGPMPFRIGVVEDYIEKEGIVEICIRYDQRITKIMEEEIAKHPERITIINQLEEPYDIWTLPTIVVPR